MNEESQPRPMVGVSVLCYGPLGAWFPTIASWWAKRDGFWGLQMLPVVGFIPRLLALPIFTYEDVWCPGNLPWMFLRARVLGLAEPTVLDLALFPWLYFWQRLLLACLRYSGAPMITHGHASGGIPTGAIEVNPGLWATPAQILEWDQPVVLDTYHLRRPPKPDHREQDNRPEGVDPEISMLGAWQEAVDVLAPSVVGVHVSPNRGTVEAVRFAMGEPTVLAQMIRHIKARCDVQWWIVETEPAISPWKNRRHLRQFLAALKAILDE